MKEEEEEEESKIAGLLVCPCRCGCSVELISGEIRLGPPCPKHQKGATKEHIFSYGRVCLRCGNRWIATSPNVEETKICPKCKSQYWNEPDPSRIPKSRYDKKGRRGG